MPHVLLAAAGVLLGAATGSYLACAAYRLPRRLTLGGRSFCPACGKPIPARYNLPVLGFLILRGRAVCCGARISARYPAIEAASALLGALLALAFGLWVLVAAVIVATLIPAALSVLRR